MSNIDKSKWKLESCEDIGQTVRCDLCDEDWTGRPESGGFLLQSKAVCPTCAPQTRKNLKRYNEESFIRGECPPSKSYAQWVIELRGGDNTVRVYTKE